MEGDDKKRLLVASLLEWTQHTPLDYVQYATYVTDLQTRNRISEQDVTELLQVYTDWHVAD